MYKKKYINLSEKRYLLNNDDFKKRTFYLLPKIHKEVWSVPNTQPKGRPIVNCRDTESYKIAIFIDYFLQPLVKKAPSYIRDSFNLIGRLKNINIDPSAILISIDIVSLYTNIPIDGAINSIKTMFERFPDKSRPDSVLINLIKIILYNNDFSFNNKIYIQKKGVAMGQRFAPSVANIYLALWEEGLQHKFNNFPTTWFRYIDDIFCIWNHDETSLLSFLSDVNNFDANIKITHTFSPSFSTFLDLTLYKQNDQLHHKVHFKSTNSHSILHTSSHHPKHIFRGIIYSQIRRWASLCSSRSDFENTCKSVFPIWRQRGYTKTLLRNTKKELLQHLNLTTTWEHKSHHCHNCNHKQLYHNCQTFHLHDITYSVIGNYSCLSSNVIYLIFCNSCQIHYVGQTTNFHDRLNKHIESIKNHCHFLVHKHFWNDCNINNFRIFIIDSAKTVNKLKLKEANYIRKFQTRHPLGFNMTENYSSIPTLTLPYNKISYKISSSIKSICSQKNINFKTVFKEGKSLKEYFK